MEAALGLLVKFLDWLFKGNDDDDNWPDLAPSMA